MAGAVAGLGAVGLFLASAAVQRATVGADDAHFVTAAVSGTIESWRIALVPVFGGLVVGLLLALASRLKWIEFERPGGIAEVIDARAARGGRLPIKTGLTSALLTTLSLGSGASTGREGPAVHLGASLAALFGPLARFDAGERRILLAAGAAAGVAASFNAPIAGALFAHEVILAHYGLRAFGPVATASVTGAVVSRLVLGPEPAFAVPDYMSPSVSEIAGALPLGLLCGALAALFLHVLARAVTGWDRARVRLRLPLWLGPPIAGVVVGGLALIRPEVFGVGYEAVSTALRGETHLPAALILLALKIVASSVSLAGRFGGGVVAPSLFLGAVLGSGVANALGAAGWATADPGFYAVVAMGAVSGAALGAPISTSLLVFELTRDYDMTIALMLAVAGAVSVNRALFGRSFLHWQLARRGLDLAQGQHRLLRRLIMVKDVQEAAPGEGEPLSEAEPRVVCEDTLETALTRMEAHDLDAIFICETGDKERLIIGRVRRASALAAYNRALIANDREEHL